LIAAVEGELNDYYSGDSTPGKSRYIRLEKRRLSQRSPVQRAASLICGCRRTSMAQHSCRASSGSSRLCPSDHWCWCLWRSVAGAGARLARDDVVATPMQCGELWARAALRRPGRGRDHPDDGLFRGRGNSGSPPGGGNVQDGVIEGLAAGVPRRNHSSAVLLLADPAPNQFGFHPSNAAPPRPGPQNPGVLLLANSCMMECSALLRIKTMRAMFRAADEPDSSNGGATVKTRGPLANR
jgi:hypothetical protein